MKDPGFIFYPGDYLRDTQCLSEKVQVAYDRIMCEHMRNICISQQQLKFFTKRLSEDEFEELMSVVSETKDGFQIEWVAESILKRRAYSDSRRENRKSKPKEDIKDISKTYDEHMDNEIENEIINRNRFIKPLLEEITNYCLERKNNVDPIKWFNFYEAKGWMIGKNKMKDWKAAVRTWEDSKSNPKILRNQDKTNAELFGQS